MDVCALKGDAMQIVENASTQQKWGSGMAGDYRLVLRMGRFGAPSNLCSKKRMSERWFWSYEPLKPLTDKLSRARPLQGRMQQGV